MKHALRTKSVGTKVSEAELRVLESRAAAAGLTLSAWVRDVLLGSSVEMGAMAAERAILAEMLALAGGPLLAKIEGFGVPHVWRAFGQTWELSAVQHLPIPGFKLLGQAKF